MSTGSLVKGRVVRSYEASRDLLTSVENKWGSPLATVSKYTYANDELGRREWVYRTGSAFGGDHADVWGYNDRNELTSSERYDTFDPQDPNDPSDPNAALDRTYAYDPIGNRDWYKQGTDPNTAYTTNNLNQYTVTTDPNEAFTYDDDGNLTEDGTYNYTWDAENRLIRVEPDKDPNDLVQGDKKLEFKYDYMGRRVEKRVYTHNGTSWDLSTTWRFMYYNWLPLLELDVTNPGDPNEAITILRKYTSGLDLAGLSGSLNSLEDAGGIGGLLATYDADSSKSYVYFHDANGNVGQLIDRSDGSIAARYEYDAYGNNLLDPNDPNESGPYAADNPFRFSTKYFDDETGLGYWGYRYYSPRLGRWMSRDPLREKAGPNLYGYVLNSPTRNVDLLGRLQFPPEMPPIKPVLPKPPSGPVQPLTLSGCCGPEIGSALAAALHEVYADLMNAPEAQRKAVCDSLLDPQQASSAWDISELTRAGGANGGDVWKMPGCATGTCEGTVKIWGTCYLAAEVNYILFGRVLSLCKKSEDFGEWATWYHRTFQADPSTAGKSGPGRTSCRLIFLEIGYGGGHTVDKMGRVADCAVKGCGDECCKKPWTGTFTGHIGNRTQIGIGDD